MPVYTLAHAPNPLPRWAFNDTHQFSLCTMRRVSSHTSD